VTDAYMIADALIAEITTLCNHGQDEAAKQLLLKALAHPEQGWQPIESAPKDEDVLIYMPDDGETEIAIGHCFGDDDCWYPADEAICDGGPWPFQPTHWMPLPPPPSPRDAEKK